MLKYCCDFCEKEINTGYKFTIDKVTFLRNELNRQEILALKEDIDYTQTILACDDCYNEISNVILPAQKRCIVINHQ